MPVEEEVVVEDSEEQSQADDEHLEDVATPQTEEDVDVDVDAQTADEDEDGSVVGPEEGEEAEDVDDDVVPVRRGRGRPRGSKNKTPGTPRTRGRGRGRGRGKGRGITIRLPKRTGEDLEQVEESAAVAEAETPAPVEEPPAPEPEEGPTGGGKPFRRINGQVYIIENDEYVTEDDLKGDTKIDQFGNLLGGAYSTVIICSSAYSGNVRSQIQSTNISAAEPTSRPDVHARHRRCAYIWLSRLPILFPTQPTRDEAQRYTSGKRIPY